MNPGFCPYIVDSQNLECPEDPNTCKADQDCEAGQKCCKFNGCSRRCTKPLQSPGNN